MQLDAGDLKIQNQMELGKRISYVQQASAEQIATWRERAGEAEARLAQQAEEHEQNIAELAKRYLCLPGIQATVLPAWASPDQIFRRLARSGIDMHCMWLSSVQALPGAERSQ